MYYQITIKTRFNMKEKLFSFKQGRNTFDVYPGDYIMDNGACFMFCTGDKRKIHYSGYDSYDYIILTDKSKKEISKIIGGYNFIGKHGIFTHNF